MIPFDSIYNVSLFLYSITKGEILRVVLFLWKGVRIYKYFSFVSGDLGGVIHNFRCGENLFVTFKYVYLIGFLSDANSYVTGVVYLSFLNTSSTPCSIFFMVELSCFIVSEWWSLTTFFSLFPSFLSLSAIVDSDSSGVLGLDAGGDSISSTNRGLSMVLPFVRSADKTMLLTY